jgi:NAD(P)H dehydrogenase (quinone)
LSGENGRRKLYSAGSSPASITKQKKMNNLIIIAHPNQESFCYNGIFRTIKRKLVANKESVRVIDLYADDFSRPRNELISSYKDSVTWSNRIYIISPVWWFRLTPRMEIFFDEVFTPGFAYNFVPLTKLYGYPKPLLADKKVRTYLTHGAPALPVKTLYLNSVKLRLVMGVYSFVFGWFKTKTTQFWSVPFVSKTVREKYLRRVKKDIVKDLKQN